MTLQEIEEACAAALASPLPDDMKKLQKKLDGIVNMLVGQVLKENKTFDPKLVREMVLEKLVVE